MKIVVAIYSDVAAWSVPEPQVERLRREFPQHTFVRADTDEATLEAVDDAEVAFSSLITAEQFAAARRLRWVHSPAAGVGGMLFPAMVASDVVVTNSRGNSAKTIAEHVIAVTLALFRHLPRVWRRQQERVWAQNEFGPSAAIRMLRGSSVLIVGLGAIGGETARLAAGFGARVTGVRRHADRPAPEGVSAVVSPERLHDRLPLADLVVIAAPLTVETKHLIGETELRMMKRDAVLVNISRGKLVDERALVRALETGLLGGAALDVFEHEPLSPESPLWSRPDVLITPHVSGFHEDYWPDATTLFADNLRRYERGEPLINMVDKKAGY
jgi:phosphoglycerate dehydrogenase-like enzyme